jgi:CTP:molybdopterin cytidylyltransferase MocA
MPSVVKKSKKQILDELEEDRPDELAEAEFVRGVSTKPIAFRASAPLIAALDRVAGKEHRNRSNLIQHILWKYIRSQQTLK